MPPALRIEDTMPLSTAQEGYLGRLRAQLTESRLTPYLRAERGDVGRAIARYYWNVELCRAYYPVLQAIEVALRNNLDRAISAHYSTGGFRHIDSWIDRDPRIAIHRGAEGQITKAKDAVLRRDRVTDDWIPDPARTHGDLLAAMSFGFWVGLLESDYSDPGTRGVCFWGVAGGTARLERHVFPSAAGELMTSIRVAFTDLRHFRNRVFHHEPAWPKHDRALSVTERYDAILQALRWLGGEQARVPPTLHGRPAVLDEATALPDMYARLLSTIDAIIDQGQRKKAEREEKRAERDRERAERAAKSAGK